MRHPKGLKIDVFDNPTIVLRLLSREPLRISAQTLYYQSEPRVIAIPRFALRASHGKNEQVQQATYFKRQTLLFHFQYTVQIHVNIYHIYQQNF